MPPATTTDLQIIQVLIDELHLDPANPHKIGDSEPDALTRSLREFGFVQPGIARHDDHIVVGGHQRLVAARRIGLKTVPVIFVDLSPEQSHLLDLALNKISGDWDDQLLARMLADLQANAVDLDVSGFGADEMELRYCSVPNRPVWRRLPERRRREQAEHTRHAPPPSSGYNSMQSVITTLPLQFGQPYPVRPEGSLCTHRLQKLRSHARHSPHHPLTSDASRSGAPHIAQSLEGTRLRPQIGQRRGLVFPISRGSHQGPRSTGSVR